MVMVKNEKKIDIYEASRLDALYNTTYKTNLWFYRKVCRWFSKEFSTPLKEVEQLDWTEVLVHYYENAYDSLNIKQLVEEIRSNDERLKDLNKNEVDEFQRQLNAMLSKKQQSIKKDTTEFAKDQPISNLLFDETE